MREFKFRAWEKKLKEMFFVVDIDFVSKMVNSKSAWRFFNEVEMMQFTGLLDSNKNEIHEGDILRFDYEDIYKIKDESGKFLRWSDKCEKFYSLYKVIWYKGSIGINSEEYAILVNGFAIEKIFDSYNSKHNGIGEISVIGGEFKNRFCGSFGETSTDYSIAGNIFENPELLEN